MRPRSTAQMERVSSRYLVFGISDGLFLGLGLSLGVSFLNSYSFTFVSVALVGITGALSNFFSVYNAENFVTGQRIKEYKEALFVQEYKPNKLTEFRHKKSVRYATTIFIATLIGSLIVLIPYLFSYGSAAQQIRESSIFSLVLALILLGAIGAYNSENTRERIKNSLKSIGIGLIISLLSALVGYAFSVVL